MIPESLLHFVWKFKLFDQTSLKLANGEELIINSPGKHNLDSGPDFHDARLIIGDTKWAGNVEIHVNASDWHKHNHSNDGAYETVILHVVLENDAEISNRNGIKIPTLELKNLLPDYLEERYSELVRRKHPIACSGFEPPDSFTLRNWLDRLLVERLEEKATRFDQILAFTVNDWQKSLYISLARSFGFKVNALPFELLSRSLPISVIQKYVQSSFQLEALFFGQSGLLLEELLDEYPRQLLAEYAFLRKKHKLTSMPPHLWKFLRLRPVNFPTIRIAQFTKLMENPNRIFSAILEENDIQNLIDLFDVQVNNYWETHYQFDIQSEFKTKNLGKRSIEGILINAVVPFLFSYGKNHGDERMKERAVSLLYSIRPEENRLLKDWNSLNIQPDSAAGSQALIHLRTEYCDVFRCLDCSLGHRLLNMTGTPVK
jgi:hypothetical protein